MKIMILNPPMEWTVLENADDEGDAFIDTHEFGHFPPWARFMS